jgi:DNA-binding XRE family transcriptional regulator
MAGKGNPKGVGGFLKQLVPEPYVTRREAAAMLGLTYSTFYRKEHQGEFKPDAYMESVSGKQDIALYLRAHIKEIADEQ